MKEKIDLPKRSDAIYQEIECFNDYEYTNCIAYEMVIRIEVVKEFSKEILKQDDIIEIISNSSNEILKESFKKYGLDYSSFAVYLLDRKLFITPLSSFDFNLMFSMDLDTKSKIIEIEYNYITSLNLPNNEIIELKKSIFNYGYNYQFESKTLISNYLNKNRLKLIRGIKETRPILDFNEKIDIPFNLNLSKNELIAYITKIKDEYDKENSIIKSPLELLGENLNKTDENLLIHKGTGKYNKYRVADMFYIYDGIKKGIKKAKIINELNYYYYDKDNKNTNFDYKTLDKYYEIATELIDNLKYKELITGIKN